MSSNFDGATVAIQEESSDPTKKTAGMYFARSLRMDVPGTIGDHSKTFSWPYDISILNSLVCVHADWLDDAITVCMAPDAIVGSITAAASASDTVFEVSQTVIDNINVAYRISIGDEDLGEVIDFDEGALTVTVATAAPAAIAVNALVRITRVMAEELDMTAKDVVMNLGSGKVGSSYLPKGTVVCVTYHNKAAVTKNFSLIFEYLFGKVKAE